MKKCAIVTLNGYFNYGNRLQNYALQETLKFLNLDVETIRLNRSKKQYRYKKYIRKIKNQIINYDIYSIKKQREKIFIDFSQNYINETARVYFMNDNLSKLNEGYSYFIVGSDQVWNPKMNNMASFFFLNFAEKHKRIAYAPSFGISDIGSEHINKYKEWISGMNKLSVREDDGAKIIKELTGREAPVHVDPTLLLTKEKWLSISKEADNKPKGKYLLTYFLGGVPKEYQKQISKIVKANNLEVINLGDIKEKETYRTGPSEFIDYINSCSVFCTDSFHGAAFSILMEKPFIVYERMGTSLSMFSRIETLLQKFKLEERKYDKINTNDDVFNINYSHVLPILENERNKSFDYLKEVLNIKNEE